MSERTNKAFVDGWTPVHAASGFAMGLGGINPVGFVTMQLAFEIFEHTLEGPQGKNTESTANILGDLASGLLFYLWGRSVRQQITLTSDYVPLNEQTVVAQQIPETEQQPLLEDETIEVAQ